MDNMLEDNSLTQVDHSKKNVVLPYNEKEFNDFLKGLLGKPQKIENKYPCCYKIGVDEIINVYHLVEQRINQQNKSSLVRYTTTISYNDGSSTTLAGIESLETFRETKPVLSESVTLEWTYLIQFHDKLSPEKQEIQIIFYPEGIIFNIHFTARTWGVDIESLLGNYCKSIEIEQSKLLDFIQSYKDNISVGVVLFLNLISVAVSYFTIWKLAKVNNELLAQALKTSSTLQSKIDFISKLIVDGLWGQHYFRIVTFILMVLISSIFLGIWIESSVPRSLPSSLLITDMDHKQRNLESNLYTRGWRKFIVTIIVSISCSVVSSYIFLWLREMGV